jgi:hypothetical protein
LLSVPTPADTKFFSLLTGSYERLLGRPLSTMAATGTDAAWWLYQDAPFALLAQDTSDDPAFVYANISAQRRFEYSWEEFSGLSSRLSAPVADRAARDRLMKGILRDGYVEGYRGLRESATGRRFWIEDVTIWNLLDAEGTVQGQAALVPSWSDA